MKRRFARPGASLDALARALADLVDAIIGDAIIGRRTPLPVFDAGTRPLAELTRQAIACAFRLAYEHLERRESAEDGLNADSPFPVRSSGRLDLEAIDRHGNPCRPAIERLAKVLDALSPEDLDQDALGEALAKLSTTPFVRHPAVREHEEKRARDSGGSFFTPTSIVARLLDVTLEPLLDEVIEGKNAAERETALLDLSIVDPSCGSGRFLLAAAHRIAARLAQVRTERDGVAADEAVACVDVIERCIYGIDVDPLAIDALRFRLRREARKTGLTLTTTADRTICGDSLSGIDWCALPVGRTTGDAGFDLVIGNPPWTSYSGRHRGPAEPDSVGHLAMRFPEISRWPSLHSAMLALAARIVREGGRVGFVLPLRLADLEAYEELRAGVTDRMNLELPVIDAGESAFDDVVQPTGLFAFRADACHADGKPNPWPIRRGDTPSGPTKSRGDEQRIEELLEGLDQLPKFSPRTFGDPGVHTGNVAAKLISEGLVEDAAPIREGRDVVAFACLPARRSIRISAELDPDEYCRVGRLDRYWETPIILRQTADRPISARHVERTYFRNSVLACRGVEGISDLALVAFLNSAVFASLHRRSSGDAKQRRFPQVKVRALHNLPVPPLRASATSSADASLVQEIEQAASLAEVAAASRQVPDAELLEKLERLILRTFGASEELAPLLQERVNGKRSDRASQLR